MYLNRMNLYIVRALNVWMNKKKMKNSQPKEDANEK